MKTIDQKIEELRALNGDKFLYIEENHHDELAKRKDKGNNLYGLYFDKTYRDGLSAEEAATDLGLA